MVGPALIFYFCLGGGCATRPRGRGRAPAAAARGADSVKLGANNLAAQVAEYKEDGPKIHRASALTKEFLNR